MTGENGAINLGSLAEPRRSKFRQARLTDTITFFREIRGIGAMRLRVASRSRNCDPHKHEC